MIEQQPETCEFPRENPSIPGLAKEILAEEQLPGEGSLRQFRKAQSFQVIRIPTDLT